MSKRRHHSRTAVNGHRAARFKRRGTPVSAVDVGGPPRLQKVLAAAGLGSRRDCEALIVEGRVEIDRRVVTALGTRVDPVHQEIRVDGEPLARPKRQYFMLNKPAGVVSTARDPAGRPRVIDLIRSSHRLFPVGRLDLSSEGLILVTNDGELANLLAHPRYEVEKTYLAQVAGVPPREAISRLERGVHLAEGFAHAKRVRIKSHQKHSAILEVVLDEGRNREVRRLLARAGHKVLRLKRVAIGSLRLGNLAPGEYRPLRSDEVRELKESALAALKDGKRSVRRPQREAATTQPKALPPRPLDVREIEQGSADRSDLAQLPRHIGTIIGDEDNVRVEDGDTGSRVKDEETARPAVGRRATSVRPLIDVRRGIFPGGRTDDFDEDEIEPMAPRSSDGSNLSGKTRSQHGTEPAVVRGPRTGLGGKKRRVARPYAKGRGDKRRDQRSPGEGPPATRRTRGGRPTGRPADSQSKRTARRKGRRG